MKNLKKECELACRNIEFLRNEDNDECNVGSDENTTSA